MKKRLIILITCLCTVFAFTACGGPSPEELYGDVQKQVNKAEKLESSYFAQYYDMAEFDKAVAAAEKALKNSDEENYEAVLGDLEEQCNALSEFINEESQKYYNAPTAKEADAEYPFAVEKLSVEFQFDPAYKVSSKQPEGVSGYDSETTDSDPYANIWMDSESYNYVYKITQKDTKEVDVKTKDGKMKTALVNTEIVFTPQTSEDYDEYSEMHGRPMYLVENKKGQILLLIQDYEGGDFYIPYKKY